MTKYRVWSWFGPYEEYGHFISDQNKKIIDFNSKQQAKIAAINYKNNYRILTTEENEKFIEKIPSLEEQINKQKVIFAFDDTNEDLQETILNLIRKG